MSDEPQTLSDLNLELDGLTADDVIEGRKARQQLIAAAARRGNRTCQMSMNLDSLARQYGVDVNYSEDLDEEDMY